MKRTSERIFSRFFFTAFLIEGARKSRARLFAKQLRRESCYGVSRVERTLRYPRAMSLGGAVTYCHIYVFHLIIHPSPRFSFHPTHRRRVACFSFLDASPIFIAVI